MNNRGNSTCISMARLKPLPDRKPFSRFQRMALTSKHLTKSWESSTGACFVWTTGGTRWTKAACFTARAKGSQTLSKDRIHSETVCTEEILQPQTAYEGADLPVNPSAIGVVTGRSHELHYPGIFMEADGLVYLLYSVAGTSGIAIAGVENGG